MFNLVREDLIFFDKYAHRSRNSLAYNLEKWTVEYTGYHVRILSGNNSFEVFIKVMEIIEIAVEKNVPKLKREQSRMMVTFCSDLINLIVIL